MRILGFVVVGSIFISTPAFALQPLRTFVDTALKSNNGGVRARALEAQAEADASTALGKALPSVDVRGIYARSQLNPQFPGANGQPAPPLVPQDIWAVNAGLTIPISVGAWEKRASAKANARAAEASVRDSNLTIERDVTKAYYDVVGSEAVVRATKHRLELATSNADNVKAMQKEGEASGLDFERTRADVAKSEQDVADAESNVLKARRALRSLTGVTPEEGAAADLPTDDLSDVGGIDSWMGQNTETRPAVASATASTEAAEKSLTAAKVQWLPTISGTISETYTNATENLGRKDFYSILAIATWHLDFSLAPTVRSQRALLEAAKAQESQARIDADDNVYSAWVQVKTDIRKAKSARVGADAATKSADLARAKYKAGEATQIDVLTAEQTAVEAEVARIRVDADLAYARAALRLSTSDGKGRDDRK